MGKSNAVGWFDVYVSDMGRAVAFYETVLKEKLVKIDDPTGETQMMSFPGVMTSYGAAGALVKSNHTKPGPGGTMIYFSVEDCAVEESRVVVAGGKVIRPKFSIGSFGWITLCIDSEGNLIGFNSVN
ncbi:MAG: VOC family protein [Xanthomonadaceae bacterium]|nr:VOC family protein [Xanthomonadaceae bacterium]